MSIPIKGKLKRTVNLACLSEPVVVDITAAGIEVAVKGCKAKLHGTWDGIVKALNVPMSGPSYLHDKPMEFLAYMVKKQQR